ncbi:MAG: PAS domain S-box protein, partial [Ignavibacteria bacterium]
MSTSNSDNPGSNPVFNFISTFLKNKSVRQPERKRIWTALALLTGGLLLTITACLLLKAEVEQDAKNEFDFACTGFNDKIISRLYTHVQLVQSGASFFENSETVTQSEWRNFTASQKTQSNSAGIYGAGYAEIIPQGQSALHEKKIRGKGVSQYSVKPAGEREISTRVTYIEPFSGENLHAFGYDVFSDPVCRKALETARDYNIVALSGRIPHVQGNNKHIQADAFMCAPVYKKGMPKENLEECRRAVQGWVFITYRMNDLINGIFEGYTEKDILSTGTFVSRPNLIKRNILLEISDNFSFDRKTLLFDGRKATGNKEKSSPLFSLKYSILVNNARWYSRFTQYDSGESGLDYSRVWYVAEGGTGICVLLFVLYLSLINTNIRAHKLAEELTRDLSESEAKYKTIFKNEIYAICIFDLETFKFLDVNEAHCSMYGYSREELLSGMTIHDVTDEPQVSISSIGQVIEQRSLFIPLRYHRKKDGAVFPCEIVAGSYMWKGRNVMFALMHDITERRRAEDLLKQTRQNYETFFNTIDDFLFVLDEQGNIIHTNNTVINQLEYTGEELAGQSVLMIHPPEMKEETTYIVGEMLAGRTDASSIPVITKSGWRIPVETRVNSGMWDGKPVVFMAAKDISMAKLAEEKFSKVFYLNPSACGLSDMVTGKYVEVNDAFCSLFGFEKEEVTGKTSWELGILTREAITAVIQKADDAGRIINIKADLRTKNGDVRHVLLSAETIHLQDRILRYTVVHDITELKRAQDATEALSLRNRIFLQTADGTHILDEQGNVEEVNTAFCNMLGYTREELLKLNVADWDAQFPDWELLPKVTELINNPAVFTTRYRHKDGSFIDVEINCTGVTLEGRQYLYASARDITERRHIEKNLQLRESYLSAIIENQQGLFWLKYPDGRILFANSKYLDALGL